MISAKVHGLPDLKEALRQLVPKLRRRALRNALAAGAREIQKEARSKTPVMSPAALAVRKGYRAPGTVKKAISVRTSKLASRAGDVGVFVNVRPAKTGARGAKNPRDPFYWRWQNWGWNAARASDGLGKTGKRFRRDLRKTTTSKRIPGRLFLEAGAAKLEEALAIFLRTIGPAIAKLNQPKAPAP
jgi:HK97 gp10 family phage protein